MISSDYTQKVMEDLDALLADLQSTTSSHNRFLSKSTTQQNSQQGSNTGYVYQTADQSQRRSETPPPLPPPPQDLLETIPPPDQFGDQYVYEGRSGGGVRQEKTSTSSGKFQGSNPQVYPPNPVVKPAPALAKPNTPGMSISNNLSELDQLLQDLNSSQFLAEVDKKHPPSAKTIPNGSGRAPPPVAPKPNRDRALNNATVDSLLDQLECAVPYTSHTYNDDNSFPPPPSDAGDQGGYLMATNIVNYSYLPETAKQIPPKEPQVASTATRELDDLMASLSEFKLAGNAPRGGTPSSASSQLTRSPSPCSEPNYAKPYKSRNLSQGGVSPTPLSSSAQVHMEEQMSERMEHHMQHHGELESMLGDLQSNLDRQGVSAKTKGLCAACNKAVVGQVITALGKIWHIEHFICAHCKDPLGTQNFYERDGAAYCERDYHSIFAPRCFYCNGPIVDKCVTALNRTWHPEHFFCAQCGRPFGEDGFHEKDGKAYCRADYFEMFAPKCGGCGRPIMENYISALNRHWHPDCFACWECRIPFNGGSFFDHEGLPYCETHYHAKRGSLCAGCQKPITGRCITAMYKKFHPEHFVCAFCLKQLNKGTFKEQNDKPYCHPCFVKLFG